MIFPESRLLTGVALVLGAGMLLVLLVWAFQRRLIYIPYPASVPPAAEALPGAEDVMLSTEDGLELGAWWVPPICSPDSPGGAEPQPALRGAVIVFNGNAGNRSFRAPIADSFIRSGFAVLLFDYRGYGGNAGSPTETGLLIDARAAADHVRVERGVDPRRTIYYGESLGTAVAIALAREQPPAALVLKAPFTSLVEVARRHYPFLPVRTLLKDRFPAADWIAAVDRPVLVVSGESDSIVPTALSRGLFDAAPGSKRFVLVPGANHNDLELHAGTSVTEATLLFLEDVAGF